MRNKIKTIKKKKNNLIIIIYKKMCYLKNMIHQQIDNFDVEMQKDLELSSAQSQMEQSLIIPTRSKYSGIIDHQQKQILSTIIKVIYQNNSIIQDINHVLASNSQKFGNSDQNFDSSNYSNNPQHHMELHSNQNCSDQIEEQKTKSGNITLCQQLFGDRKYRFHLKATHQFQHIIYKQRNFCIGVRLVGNDLQRIRNCNLITLCLAVSTTNAKWIHENRVGDPLLKGKTQLELYNGQASFEKVYAREVSRFYPSGKVAIVIYPKPSTLKYSVQGLSLEYVNPNQIEPLLIENISIMVKRKQ